MSKWFTHSQSKECEECGMPFEDNFYESSNICKHCQDLMDEPTEWEVDDMDDDE